MGIVGLGFGQQVHAPIFLRRADCEVVGIAASGQDRANEVARKLGIPHGFGDWRELVTKSKVDLISIATPPAVQYEIAKTALRSGISVLCEKPLALDANQSGELQATAGGTPAMVDFEFPEIECWRACSDLIGNGSIGPICSVDVRWTLQTYANLHGLKSWKTCTSAGGGALFSFGSHVFHYLEWLAGPLAEISAVLNWSESEREGGDTKVTGSVKFLSGARGSITIDTNQPDGAKHSIQLQGEKGGLTLENLEKDYISGFRLIKANGRQRHAVENTKSNQGDGRIAAVGSLAGRLVNWIQSGAPAQPDLAAGHRVQTLLAAALKSNAVGGQWVSV